VFEPPHSDRLKGKVTVYIRLIGKLVVDFLFVLIELFARFYG